jgi:hypothetical protein
MSCHRKPERRLDWGAVLHEASKEEVQRLASEPDSLADSEGARAQRELIEGLSTTSATGSSSSRSTEHGCVLERELAEERLPPIVRDQHLGDLGVVALLVGPLRLEQLRRTVALTTSLTTQP